MLCLRWRDDDDRPRCPKIARFWGLHRRRWVGGSGWVCLQRLGQLELVSTTPCISANELCSGVSYPERVCSRVNIPLLTLLSLLIPRDCHKSMEQRPASVLTHENQSLADTRTAPPHPFFVLPQVYAERRGGPCVARRLGLDHRLNLQRTDPPRRLLCLRAERNLVEARRGGRV